MIYKMWSEKIHIQDAKESHSFDPNNLILRPETHVNIIHIRMKHWVIQSSYDGFTPGDVGPILCDS